MAEPHLVVKKANNTLPVTLVEAATSGVLKGIGVAGGKAYHYVRVTIDGRQLESGFLSGIFGGNGYGNNGLPCDFRFEHELKVEAWDDAVASPQTRFWISYLTDGVATARSRQSEEVGGTAYLYETGNYEEGGDGEYRVLLGAEYTSLVLLAPGFILTRDELGVVPGMVELRHISGERLYAERVPLGLRPVGGPFQARIELDGVEGSRQFELPAELFHGVLERLYDTRRGSLELVADLPSYANFPALLP